MACSTPEYEAGVQALHRSDVLDQTKEITRNWGGGLVLSYG